MVTDLVQNCFPPRCSSPFGAWTSPFRFPCALRLNRDFPSGTHDEWSRELVTNSMMRHAFDGTSAVCTFHQHSNHECCVAVEPIAKHTVFVFSVVAAQFRICFRSVFSGKFFVLMKTKTDCRTAPCRAQFALRLCDASPYPRRIALIWWLRAYIGQEVVCSRSRRV